MILWKNNAVVNPTTYYLPGLSTAVCSLQC